MVIAGVVVASTTYLEKYWAGVYMVRAGMRKQEGRGVWLGRAGILSRMELVSAYNPKGFAHNRHCWKAAGILGGPIRPKGNTVII